MNIRYFLCNGKWKWHHEIFVTGLQEGVQLPDSTDASLELQKLYSDTLYISTIKCADEKRGKASHTVKRTVENQCT